MSYIVCMLGGNTHSTFLSQVVLLQKKALRSVSGAPYLAHVYPLAFDNEILLLYELYVLKTAKLMSFMFYNFDYYEYQLTRDFLRVIYTWYGFRYNIYNFPGYLCRTEFRKHSVFISVIEVWNGLKCV